MKITVPAFVGEHAGFANDEMGHIVAYDNPEAAVYAKRHLQQVREPIGNALTILRVHEQDVAAEAAKLKKWIDAEVERLTRS
jgi:hypothetical protein